MHLPGRLLEMEGIWGHKWDISDRRRSFDEIRHTRHHSNIGVIRAIGDVLHRPLEDWGGVNIGRETRHGPRPTPRFESNTPNRKSENLVSSNRGSKEEGGIRKKIQLYHLLICTYLCICICECYLLFVTFLAL